MIEIDTALPCMGGSVGVALALRLLATQGRIEQRHGSSHTRLRRAGRFADGERIVKVVATGAVLRTEGCRLTFDSPPHLPHLVGAGTVRRVLAVVSHCADHDLPLPGTKRLAEGLGRSVLTIQRALAELHDDGRLTLFQFGRRRGAVLPDGRGTRGCEVANTLQASGSQQCGMEGW